MTNHDVTLLLLAIALLLGTARLFAEIASRLNQPAVLGELLAGIVLGPTILGTCSPELHQFLFPAEGPVAIALGGFATLSITLFLMVAGLEVDLSTVGKQGKAALVVGSIGIVFPFIVGFVPAYLHPSLLGAKPDSDPLVFALFLATAMSITALPVIAKILLDLNLFRTELGTTIIAAAVFNDLVGWLVFAFVLAMMTGTGTSLATSVVPVAAVTFGFSVFMLTVVRWLLNRALPWVQAHTSWPSGILGFTMSLTLICAAFTEWIGVHAVFGAFLFGVAIGDSHHLRQRTRATIEQFVSSIFAPIFFASIGLQVNFILNFDLLLVTIIVALAFFSKIVACNFGARWAGFPKREAAAIGIGMNARGAMEIILALLALESGIIGQRLFVALVVMALLTSLSSGFLLQRLFGRRKDVQFIDYVSPKCFLAAIAANTRLEALDELSAVAAAHASLGVKTVQDAVRLREEMVTSGIGNGVAVPHVRLANVQQPVLAVGLSQAGIDFDSVDGKRVHVMVLMLTPASETDIQLDLLASVARFFQSDRTTRRLLSRVTSFIELRAFCKVESKQR